VGGKMSAFENGIICYFGSLDTAKVALPFHFFLRTIDTIESEGWTMGQNNVYVNISIRQDSTYLINERYPSSGDSDGHNI
jgi:hypothetical protein